MRTYQHRRDHGPARGDPQHDVFDPKKDVGEGKVEERGVDAARDGAGLPLRVEPRRPGGLGELLDAALEVDRGAVAPGRGELPLPEAARAARERRRRRRRRNRRRASFFFSWLFFSRKSKDVPQSPLLGKERGRRRRGQRRGLEGEERGEGEGELFFLDLSNCPFFKRWASHRLLSNYVLPLLSLSFLFSLSPKDCFEEKRTLTTAT